MNILINKKQSTLILPETINFKELIGNKLSFRFSDKIKKT